MEISVFNTSGCEKISMSFELSKVHGLIPVVTRVYLDAPSGHTPNKPIFITPDLNTDAGIPLTPPFVHYKGLLFIETFLSYSAVNDQSEENILALANQLQYDYSVFDCHGNHESYTTPDSVDLIPSKKLLYITKKIDLV